MKRKLAVIFATVVLMTGGVALAAGEHQHDEHTSPVNTPAVGKQLQENLITPHTDVGHAEALDLALKEYFSIGKALAADSIVDVKEKAAKIAKILAPHTMHAVGFGKIKAAAEQMIGPDIAKFREQLGELSHALLAQVNNYKLKTPYHVFFCDMVKKHWMQEDTKIANPYGGKEMLSCGQMLQ